MAGKSSGRPKNYTPQDVERAIEIAEGRGGKVTASEVKQVLVNDFGMKATVRPETFEAEVTRVLADRERARDEDLIRRLPKPTLAVIDEAATAMRRLMALTIGRQASQKEAAQAMESEAEARQRHELIRRIMELEAERDHAVSKAQATEAKLAAKDDLVNVKDRQIARLEKRCIRLEGMLEGRKLALAASQPTRKEEPV